MPSYKDQTGRQVTIRKSPKRIVSLVPSQTELLFDLGLNKEVAGITRFCVHPGSWSEQKAIVGGTKSVKKEVIDAIKPDLILANKEENVKEQIEELSLQYPVWVSDVNNLRTALHMIGQVGLITGTSSCADSLIEEIKSGFETIIPVTQQPSTCYLIWKRPLMTIGGDTFIHDMLTRCGFQNMFANQTRYPEITIEQLQANEGNSCRLLLLPSEPFPFKQKHVAELQQELPGTVILLVDGEMFSWYGSRLNQAQAYFKKLLATIDRKMQ